MTQGDDDLRSGEVAIELPSPQDASLIFIGRIRTPWSSRQQTPHQGDQDGPLCRLEIFAPFVPALKDVDLYRRLEVLYWLDRSRRDLVLQSRKGSVTARGTFALRSPVRPNPIGSSVVTLVAIEGPVLLVRGLDCLDDTPLLDIKPARDELRVRYDATGDGK